MLKRILSGLLMVSALGLAEIGAVPMSIDTTEVDMMEAEQAALADAALNEFAAAYGIDAPAGEGGAEETAPPPPDRESEKQG